ncbi:antibiotic biosynthesis monooxygenase family protein [Saccharomonospora xinjiangensis]|uniref:Putative enzyme involved in biosynthesis of extracellular polysaccharides n=1 Tax=Saccharomonospora xinjiangensis XJ-54 TaxID=882086 RepID=I0UY94_9PSEU|nr:antibiotic biosynthesis monooxygenase [Saccharomonospora xinjiangensis]EID52847.1 putative enzyme involved in biosynthesis of extracellular polysaccharides [Saccharomonospora xinjiangensis XJ-54]
MTDNGVTLIDAWELPEERVGQTIARWRERVALVHTAPGFRDARLHHRMDPQARLGLVNVAHWDSAEDRDEALADPGFVASAATASSYATVRGGWYHVVADVRAADGDQAQGQPVTVVTAFELPAERIDGFVPRWLAHAEVLSKAPGFRDDLLHRAVEPDTHFQLVGIAHWDDLEAWRAADDEFPFADFAFVSAHVAPFRVAAEF